jgi:HAD superfamily hydrolase (TIGR01509 family)
MLRAILWDNDGVLVDTEHLYFRATREAAAMEAVQLTEEQFREVSLTAGRSMFDILRERGIVETRIRELILERNRIYRDYLLAGVTVMDGIREALAALDGRYRMGIVTSALREHFDAAHSTTRLMRHFEFTLTREDYDESKPAPDPYLAAVKNTGLDPEECVAIEDSRRGLEAALAAGLRCLVVPTKLTDAADFSGATEVLDGAQSIPDTVRRL